MSWWTSMSIAIDQVDSFSISSITQSLFMAWQRIVRYWGYDEFHSNRNWKITMLNLLFEFEVQLLLFIWKAYIKTQNACESFRLIHKPSITTNICDESTNKECARIFWSIFCSRFYSNRDWYLSRYVITTLHIFKSFYILPSAIWLSFVILPVKC